MDAPNDYKTAGIFMLIGGVMNFLIAIMWVFIFIWLCIGVCWIIPAGIALAELIMGIMIVQGNRQPSAMYVAILGIVNGVMLFNMWGMIMEILAVVWLTKPEVQEWMQDPTA
ncbi:MAG: hypothetical protein HN348_19510 [Proteobacteria bacterium]|jgi:hypothetical protein|nr:hypothetical protein [Pseudomonadota bacterium]